MEEKSHVKYFAIKLAVYIAIAVCIFIFREHIVNEEVDKMILNYFIGGLMTLYGVEEILFEIVFKDKHFWHKDKIYLGIIEITFGIVILCAPVDYETTCVVWATWSIVRESFEIKELVTEIKSWTLTIISGIESIAVIVLSVMLILEPHEHHALTHIYLLLFELVLTPLIPMLDEIILERKHKKQETEVK